jgi:WD40 repeat protein
MDAARKWRVGEVVLDVYEVREVIRSGGMGLVYRVHHRGWNVDLAVKTPRPALLRSPERVLDFEREAESWVGLGLHPHTVNCAYVRRVGSVPSVFAEWVDGGTLAEEVRSRRLYEGGAMRALSRILDIAVQCAWGLDHAHAQGLVHQDVKPANIMIDRDGLTKVTDFGLARARVVAGERGSTPAGTSLLASHGGLTPAYCSPEQARGERLTRATDVWSWALSVLEMFTSRPPTRYGQDAADALGKAKRHGPPRDEMPTLPEELAELLERCFRPEPPARPSRMDELAEELAGIYARVVGERYPRDAAEPATLIADSLSNHALSLVDLGRVDRAEELWDQALRADPRHAHAVYNRGLHLWRAGRITDAQLMADLAALGADGPNEELLAQVHRERGGAEVCSRAAQDDEGTAWSYMAPVVVSDDGRLAGLVESTYAPEAERWAGAVVVWDLVTGRRVLEGAGHLGTVRALAFTPDGRLLISGGEDQTVRVWEVSTGRQLCRIDLASEVVSVAMAGGGQQVVSASMDGALLVWDVVTGRRVHTLRSERPGARCYLWALATAADGRNLICWEGDTGRLQVWDTESWSMVRSTAVTEGGLRTATGIQRLFEKRTRLVLASGGEVALTYAEKDEVTLRETGTGRSVRTLAGDASWINDAVLSGDGRWALLSGTTGVQLWDLDTGRCLRTLQPHNQQSVSVALSFDGRRGLLCTSEATTAWDLSGSGPAAPWSYARPRTAVELAQDEDLVGIAVERARRYVTEGRFGLAAAVLRETRQTPGYERDRELLDTWAELGGHGERSGLREAWLVHDLDADGGFAISADGRRALVRSAFWSLDAVNAITGVRQHTLTWRGDVINDFALSRNGRFAVTAGEDRAIRVWDLESGLCRYALRGHRRDALAVAISSGDDLVASGGVDGTVRLWDPARGRRLWSARPHRRRIAGVAVSKDGRLVLTSDRSGDICVRDRTARRCRHVLPGTSQGVDLVALGPDGRTALSPGDDGRTLFVTDLVTGEIRRLLPGHTEVTSVAVAVDGAMGFSGGGDGTILVWDLETVRPRTALTGHAGRVTQLVPTADGRFLLSGGIDGTVRVWDMAEGRCLRALEGRAGTASSVGASADARIVLAGNGLLPRPVRVWELDWEYEFPA